MLLVHSNGAGSWLRASVYRSMGPADLPNVGYAQIAQQAGGQDAEPYLDLVQPRGGRGHLMETHQWMPCQQQSCLGL